MSRSPLRWTPTEVRERLAEEGRPRPLLLLAPFPDETQDPGHADVDRPAFRQVLRRVWDRQPWAGGLACHDGAFRRPPKRRTADLWRVRQALGDLPTVLVHGQIEDGALMARVTAWNLFADAGANLDKVEVELPDMILPTPTGDVCADREELVRLYEQVADECAIVAGACGDWFHLLRHGRIRGLHRSPGNSDGTAADEGRDAVPVLPVADAAARIPDPERRWGLRECLYYVLILSGERTRTAVNAALRRAQDAPWPLLHDLTGHTDEVHRVVWAPDGTRLASAGYDDMVRVWDATTGACVLALTGHTDSVNGVTWSPDGAQLATASDDASVRVWDATTGACVLTLTGHTDRIYDLAWSPTAPLLASGSWDTTARVWDATTGACVLTLIDHTDYVDGVAWSPDGTQLATGSDDGSVRMWDVATGACLLTLTGYSCAPSRPAWSPDGTRLAGPGMDDTAPPGPCGEEMVRVWDAASGACLQSMTGHLREAREVAWAPDGSRLASTSSDGMVRVWDAATGACLHVLVGHIEKAVPTAWSPDGSRLASAGFDHTVRVWDPVTGACLQILTGHTSWVWDVAWSPDGSRLASAGLDGRVLVWAVKP